MRISKKKARKIQEQLDEVMDREKKLQEEIELIEGLLNRYKETEDYDIPRLFAFRNGCELMLLNLRSDMCYKRAKWTELVKVLKDNKYLISGII